MLRIAITGPESSGKTALAIELAAHFKCTYIPEFARFYLQTRPFKYTVSDLEIIGRTQVEWFKRSVELNTPILIQDSDFIVLQVWMEERFHQCSLEMEALRKKTPFDHYLICSPDLPWSYDPLRENPTDRWRLFERYMTLLTSWELPFTVIDGQGRTRIDSAIKQIQDLMVKHSSANASL